MIGKKFLEPQKKILNTQNTPDQQFIGLKSDDFCLSFHGLYIVSANRKSDCRLHFCVVLHADRLFSNAVSHLIAKPVTKKDCIGLYLDPLSYEYFHHAAVVEYNLTLNRV